MPSSRLDPPAIPPDANPHYIRDVTQLGSKQSVVAHSDIYASNGMKLVAKGATIDPSTFERLTRHSLRDALDLFVTTDDTLNVEILAREMDNLVEGDVELHNIVHRSGDAGSLKHALGRIRLDPALGFRLTVMMKQRPAMFEHSLRVTAVAHAIAVRTNVPPSQHPALLVAAFCHDLGEMHTDPALLDSQRVLNAQERKFIYVHPLTGYVILKEISRLPRSVLHAVLQHHERSNGSGYPYGIKGSAIKEHAQILGVAEWGAGLLRRKNPLRTSVALNINRSRFAPALITAVWALMRSRLPEPDSGPADAAMTRKLERLHHLFASWKDVSTKLPYGDGSDHAQLAFVFDRMASIRSTMLQAGFDLANIPALATQIGNDFGALHELQAMLDELAWQCCDFANEIDRNAAHLPSSASSVLVPFTSNLRRA